ncbi:6-phosphogluconolactonase [Candidatus Methylomirabilis limnetica]|uniref:6-phosphogluconolactonase n=1 Tax=Candidatus Methylomirabilis limnetica TaxID=2033718 RepID=A0A2T4TZ64_9BACT|nr:6-phosphogluconolactonase [Candidatus Methylomirabilis limnetica]PTL36368.1 6-phosphogluconolactonase [Candidatus Methylomirabilis limnetica]
MKTGQILRHEVDLLVVSDFAAVAQEAAKQVVAIADKAVARCGRFTVALAGGSTPKRLYSLLTAEPYCTRLPWRGTHIFWGDERAAPPEHPDSNFGMARATLLSRVPIPANQVHRMQAERTDLDAAASEYESEIAKVFEIRPTDEPPMFDLILLGLGPDGHTASLFPYSHALQEATRWVAPNYIPELKTNRLTLTPPILNRASAILFLVSGGEKAAVLQAVLEGPPDPERLPAQLIRPVAGRLLWLVDQAAASRLGEKVP